MLQLPKHATLYNVHPRAVAAPGAVQDVSIHVVQSASHLGFIGKKHCADLFIAGYFPDTNVVGLDNYVALILDLRTVGVDGYYVSATRLSQSLGLWDQRGFLNLLWQIWVAGRLS